MKIRMPIYFFVALLCLTQLIGSERSSATQANSKQAAANESQTQPEKKPDVIFVPTPQSMVDKMLEMAEIKPGNIVYDLGCGDGRIVVTAAKKYGVKAVGFDIDPQRIKESKENVKQNGVEHLVTIKQADIFTLDLSEADVVTLYLLESLNKRLIPQLKKLKPGARIVSYTFAMGDVEPVQVYKEDYNTIYKWVAPIKVPSDQAQAK